LVNLSKWPIQIQISVLASYSEPLPPIGQLKFSYWSSIGLYKLKFSYSIGQLKFKFSYPIGQLKSKFKMQCTLWKIHKCLPLNLIQFNLTVISNKRRSNFVNSTKNQKFNYGNFHIGQNHMICHMSCHTEQSDHNKTSFNVWIFEYTSKQFQPRICSNILGPRLLTQ